MKKSFRISLDENARMQTLEKVEKILSELSSLDGVTINRENLEIFYKSEDNDKIEEIMNRNI